jgi:DNA primase
VELVVLLQEHGVTVQKQGRGFKLCPFHAEQRCRYPSTQRRVSGCFGCGAPAIICSESTLLSLAEAVAELRRRHLTRKRASPITKKRTVPHDS